MNESADSNTDDLGRRRAWFC